MFVGWGPQPELLKPQEVYTGIQGTLTSCKCSHQCVVGSLRDQDLILLFDSEVGIFEGRVDVLLVQVQYFVVADSSRVAKVESSLQTNIAGKSDEVFRRTWS